MGQQKQRSGTPLETQGAARLAGKSAEDFFGFLTGGGGTDPRLALLGLGPDGMFGEAANRVLRDPADAVAGLFASMRPFEERALAEESAALREMFGSQGARLSSTLAREETGRRSQIRQGFDLNRQQGLLEANSQQIQALAQLMSMFGQANQQFFNLGQPGAPVFEPSTGQKIFGGALDIAKIALPFLIPGAQPLAFANAAMQLGNFGGRGKGQ